MVSTLKQSGVHMVSVTCLECSLAILFLQVEMISFQPDCVGFTDLRILCMKWYRFVTDCARLDYFELTDLYLIVKDSHRIVQDCLKWHSLQ